MSRFMMRDRSVVHCLVRLLVMWSSDMSRSGMMDGLRGNDVFDGNMMRSRFVMSFNNLMSDDWNGHLVMNWG